MNSIYYLNKRDFEKNNTDIYYKELSKRIKTLKQQRKKPILISEYDKELRTMRMRFTKLKNKIERW